MIRDYKPEDLEEIKRIGQAAWQPIYDMYENNVYGPELFKALGIDRTKDKGDQIESHATKYPNWLYVCEEDGKIVGFATFFLYPDKNHGEIGNNAVDPNCGLRGKGQEMYAAILERFRQEGLAYAKVNTGLDDAHAPARRAYERAGFDIRQEDVTYFKKL